MAYRFIAGETLEEAIAAVRRVNAKGMLATLDRLGENVSTPEEAREATHAYLNLLEKISDTAIQTNISLKLTELGLEHSESSCYENLKEIAAAADRFNNFIRIDMEGSPTTQQTLDLFKRVYISRKNVGAVIQAYLYRSRQDVEDLIKMKARVRLCKGAYNEPPEVAYPNKKQVDENYVALMERLLIEGNYPGIATHDLNIINQAKDFVRKHKIDPSRFEFQMLYGIRRNLQQSLIQEGYNLRIYVPYGNKWYPYFMRRLAERPANLMFFFTSLLKG